MTAPEEPHRLTPEQLAEAWNTDLQNGLPVNRAKNRLRRFGANLIRTEFTLTFKEALASQCKGLSNLFLFFTALILYLFDPQTPYLIALFSVPAFMAIGALVETYAANRLSRVRKKSPPNVSVIRSGKEARIDARALVPGDIVLLQAGALVPADLRIVEDDGKLTALETPVSGERAAAEKSAYGYSTGNTTVHENMLYAGTIVTNGSCKGLVCFTGADTLTRQIHAPKNGKPAQKLPLAMKQMREYARFLSTAALLCAVVLIFTGLAPGVDLKTSFILSAVLSAASLCDCLLPLAYLTFSEGSYAMADKKFLLRNPDRLEAIASVDSVMCTKEFVIPKQKLELCSFRANKKTTLVGDPADDAAIDLLMTTLACSDYPDISSLFGFDKAVYDYLRSLRMPLDELTNKWFRIETDYNFDGSVNTVLSLHNDKNTAVIKGSPDAVLSRCAGFAQGGKEYKLDEAVRRRLLSDAELLAHDNAYVIAVASGTTQADNLYSPNAFKRLIFRGFLAFRAAVESDSAGTVYRCAQAGIRPLVATADPYYTAVSLGKSTGIIKDESQVISSREIEAMDYGMLVLNADRYRLFLDPDESEWLTVLSLQKEQGHTVALHASEQNELQLLKNADVSFAPTSACDAVRESADVLLHGGALPSLVNGVGVARNICLRLLSLRKYTLIGFLTLFITLFVTLLCGSPAFGTQELLLGGVFANLVIGITYAASPTGYGIPPAPDRKLTGMPDRAEWKQILPPGLVNAAVLVALRLLIADPTSVMFGFVLSQFLYACGKLRPNGSFLKGFGNKRLYLAFACIALVLAALICIPFLREAFALGMPSLLSLAVTVGSVILAFVLTNLFVSLKNKKKES